MGALDWLGHRALLAIDPETAHSLAIRALGAGLAVRRMRPAGTHLGVRVCGIDFPNPLGLAAGFDKNGEVPDALLALGFGFVEIGTVTPLPQPGNDRPRIFRLSRERAVINRLGFNNEGHDACLARLLSRRKDIGIVGVNIGANKDSRDRIGDYELGVRRFGPVASYLTINVSSPNTPGLRELQGKDALRKLLRRVTAVRKGRAKVPIFLKIAPDLTQADLADIAAEVLAEGIDGVVISNTTLSRSALRDEKAGVETGGLSGKPLFVASTIALARMRRLLGAEKALIGVGGVDSADSALEKIRAGADLVQLYTGLIYAGVGLPGQILAGMDAYVETRGLTGLRAIRDTRTTFWADKAPLP